MGDKYNIVQTIVSSFTLRQWCQVHTEGDI